MARPLVALLLVTCGKVCALSIAGFLQDQCFLERAHSVAISGNFAYVGGYHPESGLTVMDITDPSRLACSRNSRTPRWRSDDVGFRAVELS